ncbi:hypothetical protein PS9374_04572 [Planomonospora sphaerica]|uniref:Uncharacterized protein n=1 Tax=Planomonospora sphaerica TaxID=161355 RepID=A0A171DJ87_9ACTN|nr:hypothetical protein [Planomonospora sphaerica]GAT68907.1 hypothetical protein PS9374_04572 [Planomonospora sphaerica]
MEQYDTAVMADCFASAKNTFNCLIGQLTDPATAALSHDLLEDLVAEQGRELLRRLLQAHLDLRAMRERRATLRARRDAGGAGVIGADEVVRRRLETGHHRQLATMMGTVTVTRCAWRAPGAANLYPADAALSLPAGRHSAGLARLAVREAVHGSFDAAQAAITSRCGPVIGKRQLQEAVVAAAADIDAFYAQQIPLPCTAEELLVLSGARQGRGDAPRRLAAGRPAGGRAPPREVPHPAGLRGEALPQAHGHAGRGLRRRSRTPPAP